jgi:hypothetical protein
MMQSLVSVGRCLGQLSPPAWSPLKYDYLREIIGVNPKIAGFANKKV